MNCPACRDLGCSGCRLDKPDHELLRTIAILAFIVVAMLGLLASGCSFAVRAELLNPINKSGRVETSEPAQPKPLPTPPPAAIPSPTPITFECVPSEYTTTEGVIVKTRCVK